MIRTFFLLVAGAFVIMMFGSLDDSKLRSRFEIRPQNTTDVMTPGIYFTCAIVCALIGTANGD